MSKVGKVINLSFPKGGNKVRRVCRQSEMHVYGLQDTPAYLGTAIGDIRLNETDRTVIAAHITQLFYFVSVNDARTHLVSNRSTMFQLKQEPASVRKYSTDLEVCGDLVSLQAAIYTLKLIAVCCRALSVARISFQLDYHQLRALSVAAGWS